ncbi:MAG: nitrite reductase large subunit [Deltaproteobacteria bacterium]|nr:nitrite reductase large subunit [Deltaproteobacteria bacterium]
MSQSQKPRLVVVGNGMVGHRFLEVLANAGQSKGFDVTVFGEEPRAAYDRVNLSAFFDGRSADDLTLPQPGQYEAEGYRVLLNERVDAIDRPSKSVVTATGRNVPYDTLILATGSFPFVPSIAGSDTPGCFVYRTLEDLDAIRAWSADRARTGVVIGGGLLGLEAANALRNLGLAVHIVEFAPRLMALQVDEAGGSILRRRIEGLGVSVHTGKSTTEIGARIDLAGQQAVTRLTFADGGTLPTDIVVFSAGIRPRDELARAAGLEIAARGGITVDERCRTSDPDILAIGECASYEGRTFGLVAPGYHMAKVALATLMGGADVFTGFDMSTKLKLMGVDVASFGDAFGTTPGAHVISAFDTAAAVYKKLVISGDRKQLLGGILVGDAGQYGQLLQLVQNQIVLPPRPEELIFPQGSGAKPAGLGVDALPGGAVICSCNNVDKAAICQAIADGAQAVPALKSCTKAGTGCGSCVTLLTDLLKFELKKAGVAVNTHLCEHFPHARQDLYHLVRLHGIKTFDDLLDQHGQGRGCEICKPAVASILASAWNEHVLNRKHIPLQDTNDRFLANIQRDGTYSVVPRVPAGEITPDQLIAIGQVAKRYALYSKITGGQRIDLFGARLEQLPQIWSELIAAGFESGHAYGKALRTVKSCVGDTWCRYGVQDSVGFAGRVEQRYKGLRSPHKLKSAVSGCARECAEAQSKDFGIIATEKGWNLYLCGNGGMKPQHAQLFATDLDEQTLVKYLDRFLMFYIRTADRLQRTATWFNNLEGGMDYLREVIIDDKLGIATELEAEMAHVVGTYQCEWKTTLQDPDKMARFRPFVNSDAPDPSIVFVPERAQMRPAYTHEKRALLDSLTARDPEAREHESSPAR